MSDDAHIREEIKSTLAGGLDTEVEPRADRQERINEIIGKLRQSKGDIEAKLVIGGFTLKPFEHDGVEQLCETCMYYKSHRRYCDLPELDLPVEAEWSCRLWRI